MTYPAIFLLITFCCGYYFTTIFRYTQYRSARESGHRLYFRVAVWGVVFVALTSLMLFAEALASNRIAPRWTVSATSQLTGQPSLGGLLKMYFAFIEGPMLRVIVLLSLPLTMVLTHVLNLFFRIKAVESRMLQVILRYRDFEKLILYALENAKWLLVTLDTGKVHLGWVVMAPNPSEVREHLRIMPIASGYRDAATHKVRFTIYYDEVLEKIGVKSEPEFYHLKPEDFHIVLLTLPP